MSVQGFLLFLLDHAPALALILLGAAVAALVILWMIHETD